MQEESGKMTAQEYLGQVEQKIIAVKNINSGINNLREILISIGGADSGAHSIFIQPISLSHAVRQIIIYLCTGFTQV